MLHVVVEVAGSVAKCLNHQGKQHQGRCQRNSWIETARTKRFDNKDQTGEY